MEYKYLSCDYNPCELYTSADSEKCEYMHIYPMNGSNGQRMGRGQRVIKPKSMTQYYFDQAKRSLGF